MLAADEDSASTETTQLQVDVEARVLTFNTPDASRERLSCAAVTARPQSRLGVQLKIQSGATSLTKKISFLSDEERANFIDALEQGKVPWRGEVESQVSEATPQKSLEIIAEAPFPLLPGERVLEEIQRVTNLVVMSQSDRAVRPALHIVDARDFMESAGNKLKGKGIEKSQHYDNAHVESVGIANMHKMRDSFNALKSLILGDHKNFYSRLEGTKWLKHVIDILTGACRVVEILHDDGASLLVHCSDGWNRTPQFISLAQLMLDPYYRTIRGFAVLVEKEWCSLGHKLTDRIGVGKDSADQPNERSPVMLQFLDCVWQLQRQFPTAFEFTEKLLLHVWDAMLSGRYGTLLYNTERERVFEKVWERTESAWTSVLADIESFRNTSFAATTRVLRARTDEASIVLWESMAFRWDVGRQVSWWNSMGGDLGCEEDKASFGEELSECSSVAADGEDAGVSSYAKVSDAPTDDNLDEVSQVPSAGERARERNHARNILSAVPLAPDKHASNT